MNETKALTPQQIAEIEARLEAVAAINNSDSDRPYDNLHVAEDWADEEKFSLRANCKPPLYFEAAEGIQHEEFAKLRRLWLRIIKGRKYSPHISPDNIVVDAWTYRRDME